MLSCGSGTVSGTLQFHTGQSVPGQSEPGGFSPALSVAVTALVLLCHLPEAGWRTPTLHGCKARDKGQEIHSTPCPCRAALEGVPSPKQGTRAMPWLPGWQCVLSHSPKPLTHHTAHPTHTATRAVPALQGNCGETASRGKGKRINARKEAQGKV